MAKEKRETNKPVDSFSCTSKTIFANSKRPLAQIKAEKAQELLTHVVRGEEDSVLGMIKKHPELLLMKSEAKDYSGRKIIGTAFQAALGAEDVIMCQKILPYFDKLKEGKQVALKQFNEQFPNDLDAEINQEKQTVYNFEPLIKAIINNTDVEGALEKFRKDMTANKEIRQGKHFNIQHLIGAYFAYNNYFDRLANWNNLNLFWRKVIGFIQKQIPANYAQAYCSSLYYDAKKYKIRTLKLEDGTDFYSDYLGFDFAVLAQWRWGRGGGHVVGACAWPVFVRHGREGIYLGLKQYVEQKQSHLQQLENSLSNGYLINRNNRECLLL